MPRAEQADRTIHHVFGRILGGVGAHHRDDALERGRLAAARCTARQVRLDTRLFGGRQAPVDKVEQAFRGQVV